MKKLLVVIIPTLLLSGCAVKKHPETSFVTLPGCITPIQPQDSVCTQINDDLFDCSHLRVKVSCVRVKHAKQGTTPAPNGNDHQTGTP